MRKPRAVSAEECAPDGTYLRTMGPMLVWAGDPVDRDRPEMLHIAPDGRRMGWASMETRLAMRRLPRVGDRIQSFSAVLALADKTSHRILWAYDVEREDLLVSFEIVNLAFDIAARAPMSIPDNIRAAETTMLHTDLAPTSTRQARSSATCRRSAGRSRSPIAASASSISRVAPFLLAPCEQALGPVEPAACAPDRRFESLGALDRRREVHLGRSPVVQHRIRPVRAAGRPGRRRCRRS